MAATLGGHLRTHGELRPYPLSRVWGDAGEPIGYQRFEATPQMLENPEQEETFRKLPSAFSFNEARLLYGKQNQASSEFLQKSIVDKGWFSAPDGHGPISNCLTKGCTSHDQKSESGKNTGLCQQTVIASAA